jgi:hypothetical protein
VLRRVHNDNQENRCEGGTHAHPRSDSDGFRSRIAALRVTAPIERYSISDRTPGLRFGEDGSLTLYIQKESPGLDLEANWLPSPAGRFYLNARAYMPQPPLLDRSYRLPAVRRRSGAREAVDRR